MEIKYRLDKDTLYIYSYGELDEYSAASVKGKIDRIIDENALYKSVVFDFANVSFMDSRPSFAVNKILQISGLYEVMPKIN